MKRIIFATLIAFSATSCQWGLGELRGWDAKAREVAAEQIHQAAQDLRVAIKEPNEKIHEKLEIIEGLAEDQQDRAKIAQADHNYTPAKVKLGSTRDNYMFNAYAGRTQARVTRRNKIQAVLKEIARFGRIFKWLWRLLPYAAIIAFVLWVRKQFTQRDKVTVNLIGQTVPDKEARRRISAGSPVQKQYRKAKG